MTGLAIMVTYYGIEDDRVYMGLYPISRGRSRLADAVSEVGVPTGRWVGWLGCRRPIGGWNNPSGNAAGSTNAYGRSLSPVGAPLGGYRKQRRINRVRALQAARRCRARQVSDDGQECPF
jgi:hypothetical protein